MTVLLFNNIELTQSRPSRQVPLSPDSLSPMVMLGRALPCTHLNQDYQPAEFDTNASESLTCEDCGDDLLIPEPDWDTMGKEL